MSAVDGCGGWHKHAGVVGFGEVEFCYVLWKTDIRSDTLAILILGILIRGE